MKTLLDKLPGARDGVQLIEVLLIYHACAGGAVILRGDKISLRPAWDRPDPIS